MVGETYYCGRERESRPLIWISQSKLRQEFVLRVFVVNGACCCWTILPVCGVLKAQSLKNLWLVGLKRLINDMTYICTPHRPSLRAITPQISRVASLGVGWLMMLRLWSSKLTSWHLKYLSQMFGTLPDENQCICACTFAGWSGMRISITGNHCSS